MTVGRWDTVGGAETAHRCCHIHKHGHANAESQDAAALKMEAGKYDIQNLLPAVIESSASRGPETLGGWGWLQMPLEGSTDVQKLRHHVSEWKTV